MPKSSLFLLTLIVGCSRGEPGVPVKLVDFTALGDTQSRHESPSVVERALDLGYQKAQLEAKVQAGRDELAELQRVMVFATCLEKKSGKSVKRALKRSTHIESCRAETLALTPEKLSETADRLLAEKR